MLPIGCSATSSLLECSLWEEATDKQVIPELFTFKVVNFPFKSNMEDILDLSLDSQTTVYQTEEQGDLPDHVINELMCMDIVQEWLDEEAQQDFEQLMELDVEPLSPLLPDFNRVSCEVSLYLPPP